MLTGRKAMLTRRTTVSGLAALTAAALAAVTACSSSSSTTTSGPTTGVPTSTASSASSAATSAAPASSNPLAPGGGSGSIVVGSANFPESELLAEVYVIALQKKGIKATAKLNIGTREAYYPEMEKGALTIFPEYNGTLLTVAVDKTATAKTTAAVDAALAAKLPSTLEVLNPAPAQDSDSVTVTAATAAKYHLKTIADLKPYAAKLVLGAPPEFKTRPDGTAGLKDTYGLTFKSFVPLDESGPVTLKALTSGRVQAADVFTTTPQILSDKLVTLADPKSNFAAQNVIPLVYKSAMNPTIIATLNAVSAQLTTSALLQMDNAVINLHADYATVATAFLQAAGLT
jgi:osmoprotectant transport system substrate-binding protein